jgi:hypothetical protein
MKTGAILAAAILTGAILAAAMLVLVGAASAASAKDEGAGPEQRAAVASALAPSLVRVEYTLRYDKGEAPQASGRYSSFNAVMLINEERPLEMSGFLVGPTQVVTTDPVIHPRFIEKIKVRQGPEVVSAKAAAYAKTRSAIVLDLERPLKGAKPLVFDAGKKGPYLSVVYQPDDGVWTVGVAPFEPRLRVSETGRRYCTAPRRAAIMDESGTAVGLSMDGELPADDSWKGSPRDWPVVTAEEWAKTVEAVQKGCDQTVVRVTLHFRSPSKEVGVQYRSSRDEENATETYCHGVVLGGGQLLVLANLKPKVTARLEKIVVHPAGGGDVPARFSHTLRDYGCLVAALEQPLSQAAVFSNTPITDCRAVLLPSADITLQGENRTAYYDHTRISGFEFGWRRLVFPQVEAKEEDLFLFDAQGALLALPVVRREKVSLEERYSSSPQANLTPVAYLKDVLGDLATNADPQNVPLTEDQERRLAWLGCELQPLDQDLARANKVAEQTRDGQTGAMVSYVYPNSPAARAGIEPGYILLRLYVEGQPKPLDVRLERDRFSMGPFPWDRLDEVSEQYYDRIPSPWPSAENEFTRALTDLGFGTKFKAEFFHDGQVATKDFEVAQSPPHYDAAPRYKSTPLGLTVRDLTYEVRRYFQKKDDEPGVIVAKIEPGSKASVGGLKPYEMITHVNDKPVMNVKDFEAAVAQATDELRLEVKRMTRGRVVKIKMAAAPATEGEKPAGTKPAAAEK